MLKVSEAASLALHTMVYLSHRPGVQVSAREIAGELGVSEAHLSKVLQRLARLGLVSSSRGPKGGFTLGSGYRQVSLLDIYEAIEGPLPDRDCFRTTRVCTARDCIFGGLLGDVNKQVRQYMSATRLPDLAGVAGGANGGNQEGCQD
ncbi:MAG: Rrf2 family transcriptional regulator [Candidatus Glassbacteria bacterium]|nr:Rrf2 family transcriptional regulator [Candidatus Glassbacteria bacterium]